MHVVVGWRAPLSHVVVVGHHSDLTRVNDIIDERVEVDDNAASSPRAALFAADDVVVERLRGVAVDVDECSPPCEDQP